MQRRPACPAAPQTLQFFVQKSIRCGPPHCAHGCVVDGIVSSLARGGVGLGFELGSRSTCADHPTWPHAHTYSRSIDVEIRADSPVRGRLSGRRARVRPVVCTACGPGFRRRCIAHAKTSGVPLTRARASSRRRSSAADRRPRSRGSRCRAGGRRAARRSGRSEAARARCRWACRPAPVSVVL